jgi:hypothetical protein
MIPRRPAQTDCESCAQGPPIETVAAKGTATVFLQSTDSLLPAASTPPKSNAQPSQEKRTRRARGNTAKGESHA